MSDFKAKMHQIERLSAGGGGGAPPQTPPGSLQCSPRPSSWILGGLLLRRRERDERGGRERERGWMREGAGSVPIPKLKLGPQNYFPGAGAAAVLARGIPSHSGVSSRQMKIRACGFQHQALTRRTIILVSGEVKFIRIFAGDHPWRGR